MSFTYHSRGHVFTFYRFYAPAVAYLGMAGMARAMGSTLTGVANMAWQKLKFYLQFLEPLFCAPCIHTLQSCINTAPLPKALSRACYASTTKHYDKTVVLLHNMRFKQSWRKGPPYPPSGGTPGKKGAPKSDRVCWLRHIETPGLNSLRTDFTHFPFQYSYLSNMSKKFTFTRPVTS